MAIYHCSLKVFSRSKGHCAVAAAAYRSGSKLFDEQTQTLHHYSNRRGVASSFILLPEGTPLKFYHSGNDQNSWPSGLPDRAYLWNAAEKADNRKNSRTARELVLALPHELSDEDRQALTRDMAGWLLERYNVAVDAAIHKPIEEHNDDPRNHHAHILFSTRQIGEGGFGAKTRILDDKVTGVQETELIREVWEVLANDALQRAGFSDIQIDRRTLEDQGIDRIPEIHEGSPSGSDSIGTEQLAASVERSESRGELVENFSHTNTNEDRNEETIADGEGTEGEEDQGETTEGGGKGEGDSFPPSLDPKAMEEIIDGQGDYQYKELEKLSRRDLNAEIRHLNSIRAIYSDIPLIDQIKHVEALIERLDVRVNRLERLEDKARLSNLIKGSLEKLVGLSQELLLDRKETNETLEFTAEEKHARKRRQYKRYGTSYREGVHSQIREMRQNLSILRNKQQDYQNYKSLITTIERTLQVGADGLEPREDTSSKTQKTVKDRVFSRGELTLRLAIKANFIREHIPVDYRVKTEASRNAPRSLESNIKTNIRDGQSKTISSTSRIIKNRHPVSTTLGSVLKVKSQEFVPSKQEKPVSKPRQSFSNAVRLDEKDLLQKNPPWRKEGVSFTPDVKSVRRAQSQTYQRSEGNLSQNKSAMKNKKSPSCKEYVVQPTKEGKPLADKIDAVLRERHEEHKLKQQERGDNSSGKERFRAKGEDQRGKTRPKQEAPIDRQRYEAYRERVREETYAKKQDLPPEHQAPPYEETATRQEADQKSNVKDRVKSTISSIKYKWKGFTSPAEEQTQKPRATMSDSFNQAGLGGDKPKSPEFKSKNERKPENY